jgi:arylsulfatase A-like enzyme/Tfp pilus assembly protein PilF
MSARRNHERISAGDGPSASRFILWAAGVAALGFLIYLGLNKGFSKKGLGTFPETNVLLFTLDTTRADHIGCYGYPNVRTPNIDGLAADGFLFKNATAQAPLTLPSHSSIFTGTYPFIHGVRDNGGFYLEPEKVTLAELLKQKGWTTSAFVGAFVLDSRWGLNQGFDYYYDNFDFAKYKKISLDSVQREGGEVIKAFFDWFKTNGDRRFFSWIHLYDPHTPYEPPEPYKSEYSGRPWGLYDGEIAYVDSLIGKVLESLREKGVLDKTIIVIAADHGESLGEHGESSHAFFIYDSTVSVPLILKLPASNLKAKTIDAQVELVDIMPTLLDLLGIAVPNEVQGRSLAPLLAGSRSETDKMAYSESYYPRYHYGWSELKSLRTVRYQYIQAPRPELYDIVRDPMERTNIYGQNGPQAERFIKEMKRLQERSPVQGAEEKAPRQLDNDTLEKLRALGYVGGFTSRAKIDRSVGLSDPKDKIHLYNKLKQAEGASADREYDDALKKIGEVIDEDPGIMEARQVRGNIYMELDRPEEAIEECRAALEIDPEYGAAIFTMAQAYRKLKKPDEAAAGFRRLIQLDPKDPKPYVNLGEISLDIRDFDAAISHLEKAIAADPEHSAVAHNLLGSAYLEKKMLEPAEREIRRSLEMRPQIPDAHYNLGLLYEEKGDLQQAADEYRKEIEIHPAAYPAYFNLALVCAKTGDRQGEFEHFKEAVKANPQFARGYLFLAKAYLDRNENFDEAIRLALKGLELEPEAESAPLGHFVLADIYNRLGRLSEYRAELEKGQALEARTKKR